MYIFLLTFIFSILSSWGNEEGIKLSFQGVIDSQISTNSEASFYENNQFLFERLDGNKKENDFYERQAIFRLFSTLYIKAERSVNENFEYGGIVVLNTMTDRNDDEVGSIAQQAYLFIRLPHGKFELGSMYGSSYKMKLDVIDIARGTGGVAGDWSRFINLPIGSSAGAHPVFITSPNLPSNSGFANSRWLYNFRNNGGTMAINSHQPRNGWGSVANKISYYTPVINGYQFGVSYAPNTDDNGSLGSAGESLYLRHMYGVSYYDTFGASSVQGGIENLRTFGLTKNITFSDNLSTNLSFTSEYGDWRNPMYFYSQSVEGNFQRQNLNAYSVGGVLKYKNYGLAVAYSDWGKSMLGYYGQTPLYNGKQESGYHTYGISAVYEKFAISLTNLSSNFANNNLNAHSVSVDIKPDSLRDKGIMFYIEGILFEMNADSVYNYTTKTYTSGTDNNGYMILGGMKFIF